MPIPRLVEVKEKELLEEIVRFSDRYSFAELEKLLKRDFVKIYLLLYGEISLGYAVVWNTGGGEAELHWLEVFEEFRGRGIGKELLKLLLVELKKRGIKKLLLEVSEGNSPARGLYGRFGFRKGGIRKGYYSDGSDAILMEREL